MIEVNNLNVIKIGGLINISCALRVPLGGEITNASPA